MANSEIKPKITDAVQFSPDERRDLSKGRLIDKQFEITTFDNNSTFQYESIFRGLSLIQSFFDDTPNEDDYLENSLNCLRHIGNVHTVLYGYNGVTDENGELCLPVSAMSIEYVGDGEPDWSSISIRNQLSQLYAQGFYVSYKFLGDKIVTDFPNKRLTVAYRTYRQDEQGLPLVTEKEAEACAYWWKWVDSRRQMYKGNQLAGNVFQFATRDKNKSLLQARIPERYSQNFMDQMLNIVYSRDRKVHNLSFKPVRLS